MESSPLVSIVTVVYNGEKYIEHAISSVINQSYFPIEYIIIDGGSTDRTLEIINRYRDRITFVLSEKDRGISDAFNKGLKISTGEIIGLLNADDWYEVDAVKKAATSIKDADIIYGDLRLWKDDAVDFVLRGDHRFLKNEMTINHPTVFVKRKCYMSAGFFNEQYKCAMDYDLMLRFLLSGYKFIYLPEVITNMRWNGLSDERWMMGCRETLLIKNKHMPTQKLKNRIYYYKHVLAIGIPKLLAKAGLGFLVKIYRTNFSRVGKVY